ncbi:hypothetical protein DRH27_03300, partial [Candidatus Falkowbacteria bacterium]
MSQTSYNLNSPALQLGMKLDAAFDLVEGSWAAQEVLPIGRVVRKTVGIDNGVELPAVGTVAADLIGAVISEASLIADVNGLVAYDENAPVNVMRDGKMVPWCETAFDPDTDTVHVRIVAGGAGELVGQIRNDVDGGDAIAWPNATVRNTLAGAGLAEMS